MYASNTPVLVRFCGQTLFQFRRINDLHRILWKETMDNQHFELDHDFSVWTDQGWTDVKSITSRSFSDNMIRVETKHSSIDVTKDHHLIKSNGRKIKVESVVLSTSLLHLSSFPEPVYEQEYDLNEDYAYLLGCYFAHGWESDGQIHMKNILPIWLNRLERGLLVQYPDLTIKYSSPDGYSGNVVIDKKNHSMPIFSDTEVPLIIVNGTLSMQKAFWQGSSVGKENCSTTASASLFYIAHRLNLEDSVYTKNQNLFCTLNNSTTSNQIVHLTDEVYFDNRVYNLSTTNNRPFVAGIGKQLIQ